MSRPQFDESASKLQQASCSDGFIELTELDFDDLPPTDPVGFEPPPTGLPRFRTPAECVALRPPLPRHLSAPPIVCFDDPEDEEAPSTQRSSLAPLSATAPPPRQEIALPEAHRIPPTWRILIAAVSVAAALGVLAFRTAQTSHPSSAAVAPAITETQQETIYTPDDFPVVDETAENVVAFEWIDLSAAPPEDDGPQPIVAAPSGRLDAGTPETQNESEQTTEESEQAPAQDAAVPVHTFDSSEAASALAGLSSAARACRGPDDPAGSATLAVTFAPNGRVTTAQLEAGPFVGTAVGGCIARAFRNARVMPFEGSLTTVHKTVVLR